jgi:uncharacterized membrane protein YcaP (DUF421 family)
MELMGIDWDAMFKSEQSLAELFVRATLLYFVVFGILRATLRRSAGELTMLDFIFVLLVANGAADAMTGGATSIPAGVVTVVTVVVWNYLLNSLGYYISFIERLVAPPPLLLIKDGKSIKRNLEKEFISEDELTSQLRQQGIDDIGRVREGYLESNGHFSFLTQSKEPRKNGNAAGSETVN